jgi:hypothetical protein
LIEYIQFQIDSFNSSSVSHLNYACMFEKPSKESKEHHIATPNNLARCTFLKKCHIMVSSSPDVNVTLQPVIHRTIMGSHQIDNDVTILPKRDGHFTFC